MRPGHLGRLLPILMLSAALVCSGQAVAEQSEGTVYTVLGDVRSPGQFTSPEPLTVRDAAVSAEPTTTALRITVLRAGQNRNQWTTMVNLQGTNNSENVVEGDILLVESVGRAGQISENAAIRTRNGVTVISLMDEQVSVGDVLAGIGMRPQNSPRVDIVTRLRGNRPQKNVAIDTPILHGDILVLEGSETSSGIPFVTGPGSRLKVSVSEWGNSGRSGRLGSGSVQGGPASRQSVRDEFDDRADPYRDSYGSVPVDRDHDSYGYARQDAAREASRGEFDRPRYAEDYRAVSERNDVPVAPPWAERPREYDASNYPPPRSEIPPEYRMPRDRYRQEQSWGGGYGDPRMRGGSSAASNYPAYGDSRGDWNDRGMPARGSFVSSGQDYPPGPGGGGYGPATGVPDTPQPLFPGAVPSIPALPGAAGEESLLKDPLPAFPNLPSEPLRPPGPAGAAEPRSFSGSAIAGELNTTAQPSSPPPSPPVPQAAAAEGVGSASVPSAAIASGAVPTQSAQDSQEAEAAATEVIVPPPVPVAAAPEPGRSIDAVEAASAGVLNTMVILAFLVTGGWLMMRAFSNPEQSAAGSAPYVSAPETKVPVSRPVVRAPVATVPPAVDHSQQQPAGVQPAGVQPAGMHSIALGEVPVLPTGSVMEEPQEPAVRQAYRESGQANQYVPFSAAMRSSLQSKQGDVASAGSPEPMRQIPPRSLAADLMGSAGGRGLEQDVLEGLLSNQIPRHEQSVSLPDGVRIYGRPGHPEFARTDAGHAELSGPRHSAAFGVENQRRQHLDERLEQLVRSARRRG